MAQDDPGWAQHGSRKAQDGSKLLPKRPKMAPRQQRKGPGHLQEALLFESVNLAKSMSFLGKVEYLRKKCAKSVDKFLNEVLRVRRASERPRPTPEEKKNMILFGILFAFLLIFCCAVFAIYFVYFLF